jgi:polar amino acid transport system substrate-binding protein
MKRYLLCAATVVMFLVAPAGAEGLPPLRTAIDATFAPHAFPNLSGGGYQGFNIDLADALSNLLKRKIVIDTRNSPDWSRRCRLEPITF